MKKVLIIIISAALVAAIAIGGTLAYLTSSTGGEQLVNTFVYGSGLSITLDEGQIDPETGLKLTDTAAQRVTANQYPIIPGATMDKDPTITVKADSEPCYVFAYVTSNATLNGKNVAEVLDLSSDWREVPGCSGLYVYYDASSKSPKIVPKDITADQPLPSVFTQIKISDAITLPDTKGTFSGGVHVQAYAHQASGNVAYDTAKNAAIDQFT